MAKTKSRLVIVGNGPYGLYYGSVRQTDAEILAAHAVRLYDARHIAYWRGDVGGITSLAATGPREGSRIGRAVASSLICDVKALHDVSPAAAAAFDAMGAT